MSKNISTTPPVSCALCPRRCGADRSAGQTGFCGAGGTLKAARAALPKEVTHKDAVYNLSRAALIPAAFMFAIGTVMGKTMTKTWEKRQQAFSDLSDFAQENFSGIAVIKAFVKELKELIAFRKLNKENEKINVEYTRISVLLEIMVTLLVESVICVILGFGGYLVYIGQFNAGQLVEYIGYFEAIVWPNMAVAMLIEKSSRGKASLNRITELLDAPIDVADRPGVPDLANVQGGVEFRDLTFRYPDGVENVLEHFSLDIPAGTTVAIVGETGAGKSTLVNLACRFFEPTEGRILIDGKDYRERSMLWLHSSIGYVLQTPHLFSGSVRDNIRYGRLDATDEEIEAAAKLVSAHDAIMHMENGYDSDVGEGGDQLSTGEKQLISFARAVLADPRIFVLDEATASIDTKTEELIQHAISTLLENRTSFLIAHRLSTIRHADLILVVRAGKIIEQGTHEELLQNKGYYADLYNKQFEQENVKHVFGE